MVEVGGNISKSSNPSGGHLVQMNSIHFYQISSLHHGPAGFFMWYSTKEASSPHDWTTAFLTAYLRCSELIFSSSFVLNILRLQGSGRIWHDDWDVVYLLLHKRRPGTHLPLPSQVSWSPPEQISLFGVAQTRVRQWTSNRAGQVVRVQSCVSSLLPFYLAV